MMNSNDTIPRRHFAPLLAQKFTVQYNELMPHYEFSQRLELTEHLLAALEYYKQTIDGDEQAAYDALNAAEDTLLTKYGSLLKPYRDKQFYLYFDPVLALPEKAIISTEQFNSQPNGEQGLSPQEILQFVQLASNALYNAKQYLQLEQEPSAALMDTQTTRTDTTPGQEDAAFTRARQLLALHYLLSSGFGIEPRSTVQVSSLARFAHLMTGTAFTTLQNSEIYKKYRMMPNYKKGQELLSDLLFIRPYFAELGLTEAVKQIDAEVEREKRETRQQK